MTRKCFLLFLVVQWISQDRKRFEALKMLEKAEKHFLCFQTTRLVNLSRAKLPPSLSPAKLPPSLSPAKLFVTSHCVPLPYLMLH